MSAKTGKLKVLCHKTELCLFYQRGRCARGEECTFAHDARDVRSKPNLHCTKLCPTMAATGECSHARCPFAHEARQLRKFQLRSLGPTGKKELRSQPGGQGFSARCAGKSGSEGLPDSRTGLKKELTSQPGGHVFSARGAGESGSEGLPDSRPGLGARLLDERRFSSRPIPDTPGDGGSHGGAPSAGRRPRASTEAQPDGMASLDVRCFGNLNPAEVKSIHPDGATSMAVGCPGSACRSEACRSRRSTVASESELGLREACHETRVLGMEGDAGKGVSLSDADPKDEGSGEVNQDGTAIARPGSPIDAARERGGRSREITVASASKLGNGCDLYKTRMRAFYMKGKCKKDSCTFAHGEHELQTPPEIADPEPARAWRLTEPEPTQPVEHLCELTETKLPQPAKYITGVYASPLPARFRAPASPPPRKACVAPCGPAWSPLPILAWSAERAATELERKPQNPRCLPPKRLMGFHLEECSSGNEGLESWTDASATESPSPSQDSLRRQQSLLSQGSPGRHASLSDTGVPSPESESKLCDTSHLVVKNTFLTVLEEEGEQRQVRPRRESAPLFLMPDVLRACLPEEA